MSEINVQLKNGEPVPMPESATVAEALKKLDRDLAKQALAAKVGGREVDLGAQLDALRASNGESASTVQIEPIVPQTRDGLEVLRHSTAHLLAAAVLDLFPGTKLGIGPALLDDPRYGYFYDVITPQPLTEADLPVIEKRMKQIASKNLGYRREEISKDEALRVFGEREEPLKCELIDEKAGEKVSVSPFGERSSITSTARRSSTSVLVHTFPTRTSCGLSNCSPSRVLTGKATRRSRRCSAFTARLSLHRKSSTPG
jgi:threonyl-tRNA synthetase